MLILVNENDIPTGSMKKMEAHEKGLLHRAFSVFIFNSEGMLLLQQRALHKYHTPGLWTNSCCSHPFPEEEVTSAAHRRLKEELGLTADLTYVFKMTYKHAFDNGLTEHEIDHVFVGYSDTMPTINPEEVNAYKYVAMNDLKLDIHSNPNKYTPWFRIIMGEHYDKIKDFAKRDRNV